MYKIFCGNNVSEATSGTLSTDNINMHLPFSQHVCIYTWNYCPFKISVFSLHLQPALSSIKNPDATVPVLTVIVHMSIKRWTQHQEFFLHAWKICLPIAHIHCLSTGMQIEAQTYETYCVHCMYTIKLLYLISWVNMSPWCQKENILDKC